MFSYRKDFDQKTVFTGFDIKKSYLWLDIFYVSPAKWSLLTLYGLFSKNKKQIAFSLFSGGRGGSKWGRDGVWGLVSRRRTTPDPIETPFGPPQPPEYRENKIDIFLFWEKTYNVNTNLSLSWAYFAILKAIKPKTPSNWPFKKAVIRSLYCADFDILAL